MPLWVQAMVGLAALYLVTIVATLYFHRRQRPEYAQESSEFFGLKKGQTIMAVVDKEKTLYFCIGRDVMDEKL